MDKDYKRDFLRQVYSYMEVDKLSDEEVDELYKNWKENFLEWHRECLLRPPVGFSTANSVFYKTTYQREMELIFGLSRTSHKNERIHFPNTPEVQKILKDMSNVCCNCRRKLNRESSDENDALDSIAMSLFLSSRTRPESQPLTEEKLQKFSEQMDEMSAHYGERPVEEVRERYRHHIKQSLISLNDLHNVGFLSDSMYQKGKEELKELAGKYKIEDFENLPYQETEDYIEKDNKKLADSLSDIIKEALTNKKN